jgi:predicted ATP-grasp superfamily ATP-dependent carboligase
MKKKSKDDFSKSPSVLLIDGGVVSLSAARSLGKHGITIYALDIPQNHGRFSKYSTRIQYAGGNTIEDRVQWLTTTASERIHGAVIFPISDEIIDMVSRYRAQLADHYILPEINDTLVQAMLDKAETYKIADRIGIPAPKTWCVNSEEDIDIIISSLSFPCALKPRFSHEFKGRNFLKKLFIVKNQDELFSEFISLHNLGKKHNFRSDLIVTELIPGVGENQFQSYYSYLDENGTPLMHFTKRKPRQYPIYSGYGTYQSVGEWNPQVAELGLKFMQGAGYLGLGAVEFKLDPRDGILKLMECNTRLTTANELIVSSGFNISLFIYNRLVGKELPPYNNYRKETTLVRPVRDFLSFWDGHKKNKTTWRSYFKSIAKRHSYEVFSWKDPMPWIMLGLHYMKRVRVLFFRHKK